MPVEGSIGTVRCGCDVNVVDEKRIDQVVSVLDRYRVVVAALQETKWFGNEFHNVGKSVVLTAGREVPGVEAARQRGEGVAIVLPCLAMSAWRAGGSKWKAGMEVKVGHCYFGG